ncbi:hypothetical protein [Microbacterium sp. NPDC090003]|uniref:hypothetical protein n=1 Tax=Microbacterium sp. NPDC090003 TaxID=3364203 RepID=UPI00381B4888
MSTRLLVKAPVDMALGERAEIDQDPDRWINGRPRVTVIDVVLLAMPRSSISRLSGVYFVTPRLLDAVQVNGLSGLSEREFTMSFDPQMAGLGEFDGRELPDLRCVEVWGDAATDDFAHLEGRSGLVVSPGALAVLRSFDLTDVRVEPL